MNRNQIEFSEYWDKIENTVFYKVIQITESPSFADKIVDNQRKKLSEYIRKEINRTFFDIKMRPKATVWFEGLKKMFPKEANKFEIYVRNCEIT